MPPEALSDYHTGPNQPCPCGTSSDAFSVQETGWGHCFSCNRNIKITDHDSEALEAPERPSLKVSAGLIEDIDYVALKSRRLTAETCRKFGYGVAEDRQGNDVQVAPYVKGGQVIAQKLRSEGKKFTLLGVGKDLPLFGQHLWGEGSRGKRADMVVVTEGEIDAMSVSQAQENRWPVVSLPNGAQSAEKAIAQNSEWLSTFAKVILMFDQDTVGKEATLKAAEALPPGKAYIATLPLKDASEMLQAGREGELKAAIWGASPWRPDSIIDGASLWDKMRDYKEPEGVSWPWEGLNGRNKMLKLQWPALHVLVAGSGAGKSTICRAIEHHLIQQGERVGAIHLEEDATETALGIVGYEMGLRLTLGTEGVDPVALRAAYEKTVGRDGVYFYDAFGSTGGDYIVSKLRFLAKAGGCRYIILDHISIVTSGMDVPDERKAIDKLVTDLRTLAEECKVAIITVVHMNRTGDGKGPENGGTITPQMIRGSGAIYQLSDTCSALERNQQGTPEEQRFTLWRSLKCRKTGKTGPMIGLLWDEVTGRMQEVPCDYLKDPEEEAKADEFVAGDDCPF